MLPCSHAILIFVLCLAFQGIRCQFDSEKTNFGLGKPPVSWSPPEFDPNDYAQDKLGDNEYCECVYFYQCDKNTRRIIDTGGGLVTWRISLRISQNNGPRKCIEVGQICCKLPLWAEQATDIPELIPLGTPSSSDQQPALPDEQQNPSDIKDEFDPDQDNEPPQDNPDSAEGNKPNKHDQAEPWPDDSNNPKEPNNDKEEPQIVEETQEDDDEDESKEVVQPLRCGERRTIVDYRLQSVASRVSGGDLETETKFGEFPWMVMLQYIEIHNESNNEIPLFLCGASLIHPQILLTAAHCIEGRELSKLRARAGEYDATSNAESLPHQDQDIESIVIHPSYNQTHPRHDIALMLLKNPFTLGDHINTICLPTDESYDPQRCVGIGWGIDNSGKRVGESQHLLRKAFLPLVPKRECQKLLRKTRLGRYFKLHSSFLCAGGQSDLDLCVGDGGGPLTCYNPKTDSEVQVGVTSWGIGCGTKDVPGVYADVAVDNDWISSTSNYLLNGAQNSDNSNTGSQLPNEESAGDTDTNQSSAGDNQDVSGGTSEDNKPPVQEEGTSADEGNSNWNDNQESAGDNKENVDETPIDDVDKPVQSDETSVDYGSSNEQTNANDNKEEISETSEDQIDEPTLPDETSTENGKPNDEDSNNPVDTEASSEETNQTNESNGEDDQSNKPSDSSKETVEDAENQPNCVCVDKNLCEEESSIKPNENTNENLDYESMDDVITWKRRNGQLCGINEVCCSKVKNNTLLCGTHKKFNYMEGMETVGDVFSRFGEFPWVLKLKKRFTEEESMECSASLLHPQVALTAAHCVLETGADDIEVRAGEWDVTNTNEPLPHQDIGVKRIILHPEFDHKNPKNDIAVLILEKPVHIADNINVICLPTPNYEVDENNCVAAGWGRKKIGGEMRAILKKVELPIVPSDKCEKNLRKTRLGKYFRLHKSFICAGGNGRDVCVGDGGSPLMCPSKNVPNTYVQVGVVSWGINCGVAEQPGVYANVKEFLDWIANAGSPEDIEPQDLSII